MSYQLWHKPGADYRAKHGLTWETSAGTVSTPTITNPSGDTIRVASVYGLIRTDAGTENEVVPFYVNSVDLDFSLEADGNYFLYAAWNSGSPTVLFTDSEADIDDDTEIFLGAVVKESSKYHITVADIGVYDIPHRLHHMLHEVHGLRRADHEGGLILAETGTRNITVTAGTMYYMLSEYSTPAFDSSSTDTWDSYYGSFTKTTGLTQWPNTQYDNAGTLTAMTTNWYANLWFYMDSDGEVGMIYGTAQYATQAAAEDEAAPTNVPARFTHHGMRIAQLTFQKSASSAARIVASFGQASSGGGGGGGGVTDHGALSGLSDDDHTQYLLADGSRSLTAFWDAGAYNIQANRFLSVVVGAGLGFEGATSFMGNFQNNAAYAAWCHVNFKAASGSYAMVQDTNGHTFLNAASTRKLWFRINNVNEMSMDASTFSLLGVDLDMQGNGIYGNSTSGGNLELYSTSNATKGKILMGSGGTELVVDDVNNRVGIGTASPSTPLHLYGATGNVMIYAQAVAANTNSGIIMQNDAQQWRIYNYGTSLDSFLVEDTTAGTRPFEIKTGGATGDVIIGNTASEVLTLTSTTKGFVLPRMTATQRTNIASPVNGMMVYDTTNNAVYAYENSTWVDI